MRNTSTFFARHSVLFALAAAFLFVLFFLPWFLEAAGTPWLLQVLRTVYLALTVATFGGWAWDKYRAVSQGWRVAEKTLLALTLAGGMLGAMAGMLVFRHKTRHRLFWTAAYAAFVLHLAILWVLFVRG
ncbi:MAG: DUF1294 domain-containing protein [Candidatus Hydrogenedentota bacterium]